MNKYEIKYLKDGHWTSQSFDTIKELKKILSELNGIKVKPMVEGMPKKMFMLCIEHNENQCKEMMRLYFGDLKSHVTESPARENRLSQIEDFLGEDLYTDSNP